MPHLSGPRSEIDFPEFPDFTGFFKQLSGRYGLTDFAKQNTDTPFRTLVACILSLRNRDEVTVPVANKLFSQITTVEDLEELPLGRLQEIIRSINFYKTKSSNLKKIARILIREHGGKVPRSKEELMALPGVGLKTTNLVLSLAFGIPAICVDTHVHRIANRLGWVRTKAADETEAKLSELVPKKYWKEINQLFVNHGQQVCKPRRPLCRECVVTKFCRFYTRKRKS